MASSILVVNPGSSSRKYAIYSDNVEIYNGHFETDISGYKLTIESDGKAEELDIDKDVFENSLKFFVKKAYISKHIDPETITEVGIRIVAPGRIFMKSRLIDEKFYNEILKHKDRAPLHITTAIEEITAAKDLLPTDVSIFAISDSEFHSSLTHFAQDYAIPRDDANKSDIYRFGYHGLSMTSVTKQLKEHLGKIPKNTIVCHLGSGASVTALRNGKSFDTSMGYSPMGGLIMATRSGDINAEAAIELGKQLNLNNDELIEYLNNKSGLLGLSGKSNDIRKLLELEEQGDENAKFALESMVYRIKKYIGSYYAVLGGLDVLVFTATAGERSSIIRERVCENTINMGIQLNTKKNNSEISGLKQISNDHGFVKVLVVPSNETKEIYARTLELI